MRKIILLAVSLVILTSCASVLKKDLMREGIRDFSFQELVSNPDAYKGKLFVLGGIIAQTTLTDRDSVIEALYVPVDSAGYLKNIHAPTMRFQALFTREHGILDPLIYRANRQITLAGTFTGVEQRKLEQMSYTYPVFKIVQIYLWQPAVVVQYPYAWAPYPWGPYWGPGPFYSGVRGYPYYWW
jgi:outer membrane lipoprotein